MSNYQMTTADVRHNATAYWSDDAIPPNHPARKDAEVAFDAWLATHDREIQAQALRDFADTIEREVHDVTNLSIRHLLGRFQAEVARLTATTEEVAVDSFISREYCRLKGLTEEPTTYEPDDRVPVFEGEETTTTVVVPVSIWDDDAGEMVPMVPRATGGALRNWRELSTEPDPREHIIILNPKEPT